VSSRLCRVRYNVLSPFRPIRTIGPMLFGDTGRCIGASCWQGKVPSRYNFSTVLPSCTFILWRSLSPGALYYWHRYSGACVSVSPIPSRYLRAHSEDLCSSILVSSASLERVGPAVEYVQVTTNLVLSLTCLTLVNTPVSSTTF